VKLTLARVAVIGKPFSPVALNLATGEAVPNMNEYVVFEGVDTAT
jgi:hypothetical protein